MSDASGTADDDDHNEPAQPPLDGDGDEEPPAEGAEAPDDHRAENEGDSKRRQCCKGGAKRDVLENVEPGVRIVQGIE